MRTFLTWSKQTTLDNNHGIYLCEDTINFLCFNFPVIVQSMYSISVSEANMIMNQIF